MIPSQPDEQVAAQRDRLSQLRSHLVALCGQIADVEDDLASTLTHMAQTAPTQRADRLRAQAAAARAYAVKERDRAQRYAD